MFDAIVRSLRRRSGVTVAAMFGAPGLRAGGKVFATLYKGDLVLKLPADRVRQLVDEGEGVPFDPGHGRVSREWIAVKPHAAERWPDLAQEAMRFVASQGEPEEGEQRRLHEPRHPVDDPVAERQHDDRERLPLTGPIVVPVFYTEIFDWKVSKAEGMDYWLVSTVASGRQGPTEPGGINGGITRYPMAGGVKQVNYVTVGSVEETVRQAERLGASVLKGKTAIPSMGWFAILADPEKNVFGIFQNDSGAR